MSTEHTVKVKCDICLCALDEERAARRVEVTIAVLKFDVCELCLETPLRALVAKVNGRV